MSGLLGLLIISSNQIDAEKYYSLDVNDGTSKKGRQRAKDDKAKRNKVFKTRPQGICKQQDTTPGQMFGINAGKNSARIVTFHTHRPQKTLALKNTEGKWAFNENRTFQVENRNETENEHQTRLSGTQQIYFQSSFYYYNQCSSSFLIGKKVGKNFGE